MAKPKGTIVIDEQRCKGCGVCIDACPQHVLAQSEKLNMKGYAPVYMHNPDACTGCANCGIVCPDGVITVYKQKTDK